MAVDVSIAISARDNFTTAITTMRNANNAFNRDLDGLQRKLDSLSRTRATLRLDVNQARSALKDATKAFEETRSEANRLALEMAQADYDNAARNLQMVGREANNTRRAMEQLADTQRRSENRAASSGMSGAGGGSSSKNIMSELGKAGLMSIVGTSISDAAGTIVSSAMGSDAGTMFGSVLSGAAAGAAMGTAVGGPFGTLIGGLVGAFSGAISGGSQIYANKDEYFKDLVKTQVSNVQEDMETRRTSGSEIAATREQSQISFATLLGSDQAASKYLAEMTEFANVTPFEYDQLATMSRTMLAYGYQQNELIPMLTKIGDAGSALGMTGEDMNYVATALGRMQSTGKTTLEYLNPLLERGIPVWDFMAKAFGKSKSEMQELVSDGLIPGEEAAEAIADYMGAAYAGNMEKQSQTFEGLQSTLQDAENNLNAAMGEGYNEERKQGLKNRIDWLSSDSGAQMEEAYRNIGAWEASLENEREATIQRSMQTAMGSAEYIQAEAAGNRAEMGRILQAAQVEGEMEYQSSEGYLQKVESEKVLINSVQSAVAPAAWQAGYNVKLEYNKGWASVGAPSTKNMIGGDGGSISETIKGQSYSINGYEVKLDNYTNYFRHATGINRVPYNGYQAILHEGERVLTGTEARSMERNASANISVNVNHASIREEADIEKVAKQLAREIQKAQALYA